MSTPEGRVKAKLKRTLKRVLRRYEFWPVQTGMGASTLDCLLCINGWFVAIETKRRGKTFTPRQEIVATQIKEAGGLVYLVDDDNIEEVVNEIQAKCFPTYTVQQTKNAEGLTKVSPLVLCRR